MYRASVKCGLALCCFAFGSLASCGESDTDALPTSTTRSSAESLLEEVKRAIAARDIEILVALGHWEGVPEKYPNIIRKHMTDIFDYVNPVFSISKMTPAEKSDSKIGDKTYGWNIEPYGWLSIESNSDAGKQGSKIPIGTKDGRYYVATKLEKRP